MEERIFQSIVVRTYPKKKYVYLAATAKSCILPKNTEISNGSKSKKTIWFTSEKEARNYIDSCGGKVVLAEFSDYCRRIDEKN